MGDRVCEGLSLTSSVLSVAYIDGAEGLVSAGVAVGRGREEGTGEERGDGFYSERTGGQRDTHTS